MLLPIQIVSTKQAQLLNICTSWKNRNTIILSKIKSSKNLPFMINFSYEKDSVCLSWKYLSFANGGVYVQKDGQGCRA